MTRSPRSATPIPARAAATTRIGRLDASPEAGTLGCATDSATVSIKVLLLPGGLTGWRIYPESNGVVPATLCLSNLRRRHEPPGWGAAGARTEYRASR